MSPGILFLLSALFLVGSGAFCIAVESAARWYEAGRAKALTDYQKRDEQRRWAALGRRAALWWVGAWAVGAGVYLAWN